MLKLSRILRSRVRPLEAVEHAGTVEGAVQPGEAVEMHLRMRRSSVRCLRQLSMPKLLSLLHSGVRRVKQLRLLEAC